MENKKFLNPQELFNEMSEMRHKAKDNLIALMKEKNLDYVHTCGDVCYYAGCDTCYCHIYDNDIDCKLMVFVQGVRLTANDKLEFDWSDEYDGTSDEHECEAIDVINVYNTVYSILVRKDGDDFDYNWWLEENGDFYK